jgi:thioredoxin reductase|tara:strand:+ start:7508 stop:7714 length:207 start_codon:yes stop_codon:yes gene_type:complete
MATNPRLTSSSVCLPNKAPQVVIDSGLTDSSGYIPVHPQTLDVLTDFENLATDYSHVYAIGDVTTTLV